MRAQRYFDADMDGDKAVFFIFGDVCRDKWDESDVDAYSFVNTLATLPDDADIEVHINSYGGEAAEGLAIYNALRARSGHVKTVVDGMACSIASVIFMAGAVREMSEASLLMIHNPWVATVGNAEELRKTADDLDVIATAIKAAYLADTSISADALDALLSAESFIDAESALDYGFATDVRVTRTNKAAASALGVICARLCPPEVDAAHVAPMDAAPDAQDAQPDPIPSDTSTPVDEVDIAPLDVVQLDVVDTPPISAASRFAQFLNNNI